MKTAATTAGLAEAPVGPSAEPKTIVVPTHEQIARRAYELYEARGRMAGHDYDDWVQAEYELMHLPVRKIAELSLAESKPRQLKQSPLLRVVRTAVLLASAVQAAAQS